ncbi:MULTISPECIES: ATP-dependent protease ATPase subunit HslU [Ureibacillus]|jgi:ATP-dependent HslUV protease ATP-binding subunit HslU|uniref:ATP-dependent protease ATPase subunit HslU n=1 Tax=Ureibacillus thermosphaericus TaxID=51173 RepID=A0A840PZ00_URETH|nr:ATP-dependent protease ATPase subunit HslU [Ureibacillus thermosphaericus]MBB5149872.1 ATP-dependent HslUV protease ATP-binding subunit HslU [Ureibacillus thermosphaericus]NKZ30968.1 ATP-dependent protease ATPase subunit HslU [Ureibacillus thermosphaericus]
MTTLTPRQIVEQLNRYIVGQDAAKRAVAIALRNRYRRSLLSDELKSEVIPKNILMIGPTGVGKTEIARRIAKLTNAPFVKVEATKFTEVGYVGRDVESMVRDLVEASRRLVKEEMMEKVKDQAEQQANEVLVKLLVPSKSKSKMTQNPFELLFGGQKTESQTDSQEETEIRLKRSKVKEDLLAGKLEDEWVTVEVTEQNTAFLDMMIPGMPELGSSGMQDMLSSLVPKKTKKRRMKVKDARRVLAIEEANKLIDSEELAQEAIKRAEQSGIIFIDEIDKIASRGQHSSADVSREGVQRDILPIVEGSTVTTKYGPVKTDYMLFIAAGAFHMSKPSDLIPELQGRFPIRVELDKLTKEDFVRILKEPDQSLILQYRALLETEGVSIDFSDDAIERIAEIATEVNQETDNIGARRLHTIMERLLEELSYEAPEIAPTHIQITRSYVDKKLGEISKNKDLSQFIL